MRNIDKHDLAVRLANLAYDYDYYNFIDSLNGDEDIEDVILQNEKDLDDPKFIGPVIEWLEDTVIENINWLEDEGRIDERDRGLRKRANLLINDLLKFEKENAMRHNRSEKKYMKESLWEDMIMPNHSFVESPIFTKKWQDEHLTDDDLLALQSLIEKNLSNRTVCIPLGSNLYKVRFSPSRYNHGKNTAKRVYFIEIIKDSNIYLIHLLDKNEASDISAKQEKDFRELANKIN